MIDPKTLRRTPHATEDGLQEGRPHPALRRYQADYKVVDWSEGLKLLGQRRKGQVPLIKGGVDDGSEDMVLKDAVLPDPFSKMHINPKEPIHKKESSKPSPKPAQKPKSTMPTREDLMKMRPGSVEDVLDKKAMEDFKIDAPEPDRKNFDPFNPSTSDETIPTDAVMPGRDRLPDAPPRPDTRQDHERVAFMEAKVADLNRRLEDAYERIGLLQGELDVYRTYLDGRMRVELQMSGMSFSISAVDVVESAFGVVVLLPMKGDSMTFTPALGADAVISCQKKGIVANAAYTGTSFELEAFGLFGLSFMKRPTSGDNVQRRGGNLPSGREEKVEDPSRGTVIPPAERPVGRDPLSSLVSRLTAPAEE
jgi:hypothetical protein